jgi:hypothetical protein
MPGNLVWQKGSSGRCATLLPKDAVQKARVPVCAMQLFRRLLDARSSTQLWRLLAAGAGRPLQPAPRACKGAGRGWLRQRIATPHRRCLWVRTLQVTDA